MKTYLFFRFNFTMEEAESSAEPSAGGRDLRSTACPAQAQPTVVKTLENVSYPSILEFPPTQIPTGVEVMGRMLELVFKNEGRLKMEEAAAEVSKELSTMYIYNLNIYPKTEFNIANKIKTDYQELKRLVGYPLAKRNGKIFKLQLMPLIKECWLDMMSKLMIRRERNIWLSSLELNLDQKRRSSIWTM